MNRDIVQQIADLLNHAYDHPACPVWAKKQLLLLSAIPEHDDRDGAVEMVLLLCQLTDVSSDPVPAWIRVEARRLAIAVSARYYQAAQTIRRELAILLMRRADVRGTGPGT